MVYTVRSAAVAAVMVFGTLVQAQSGGSSIAPSSSGPFQNSTSSVPPSSSAPPTSMSSMMSSSAPPTTSSPTSSPSSLSSTSSSSTTSGPVPGVTSEPGVNQLIGIQKGNNNNNPGNAKRGLGMLKHLVRQATGGFVGGAGPVNPQSCADATPFQLINGQLTSGGEAVSVNPGVPYEALAVGGGGSISTTFSFVDGTLHWYNAAFTGGEAGFCQVASGQVYITFQGAANAPAGCTAVTLVVIPQSECQNGVIISATTGSPTSTATFLPQSQGIFPLNASPTNEICVTTTLSFIPGEPTFIGQTA